MANFHIGKIQAKDPDAKVVGITSGLVAPELYTRNGLTVINISQNIISMSFGGTAAILYKGITLMPNGGAWSMDEFSYSNEQINAIAAAANSTLVIQEFYG